MQPLDLVVSPKSLHIWRVQPWRFELKVTVEHWTAARPWQHQSVSSRGKRNIHLPEEDVAGLPAGVGMHQLLLQVLQRAVVDIDWTSPLRALTGALLRHLPIETGVKVCCEGHRELDSIFVSWIWNKKKNRTFILDFLGMIRSSLVIWDIFWLLPDFLS